MAGRPKVDGFLPAETGYRAFRKVPGAGVCTPESDCAKTEERPVNPGMFPKTLSRHAPKRFLQNTKPRRRSSPSSGFQAGVIDKNDINVLIVTVMLSQHPCDPAVKCPIRHRRTRNQNALQTRHGLVKQGFPIVHRSTYLV